MSNKGRNAAKAFNDTRAARFGGAKRERFEEQVAQVRAGTRRSMAVTDLDGVREDDEVMTTSNGWVSSTSDRTNWYVNDGRVFVNRFTQSS